MTFSLTMSSSDLLLLLPEIFLDLLALRRLDHRLSRFPRCPRKTPGVPERGRPPGEHSDAWLVRLPAFRDAVLEHVRGRSDGAVLQNLHCRRPRFWSFWRRSSSFTDLRFSVVNTISSW